MGVSRLCADSVNDLLLGSISFSVPATWYVALSTTHISSSGSGLTEPSSGSYARVAVTNSLSNFTTSSSGSKVNINAITFNEATSAWGTVLDVALVDSSGSAANVWYYQALADPKIIQSGATFNFPAGTLQFSVSGSPL